MVTPLMAPTPNNWPPSKHTRGDAHGCPDHHDPTGVSEDECSCLGRLGTERQTDSKFMSATRPITAARPRHGV